MLKRVLRATLIAASVVAPLPASGAFVSDYSDWQNLSEVARQGFVTGAMDRLTTMISDDAEKAMANGVKTCLGTRRASLDMIAQAITDTYEADQEIRPRAAVAVLQYVVYKICERDINQRLRASGHRTISAAAFLRNLKRPPHRSAVGPDEAAMAQSLG
jgi:hypothetical protein